jgi:hypothetical protein
MAATATGSARDVIVPEPLAARLDAMVRAGEFPTFQKAAAAMIQLGLTQHEQRGGTGPGEGPAPPPPRTGPAIPPPGP